MPPARMLFSGLSACVLLAMGVAASDALASGPVKKTTTGCVKNGVFTTDDGYPYRVYRRGGGPMPLTIYNNQRIRMTGELLPGDVFYPSGAPQKIGGC